MKSYAEIPALHDDETVAFLERLGLLSAYADGELRCSVCGAPLVEAGLGAARSFEGAVVFACTKLDCLDDFHSR